MPNLEQGDQAQFRDTSNAVEFDVADLYKEDCSRQIYWNSESSGNVMQLPDLELVVNQNEADKGSVALESRDILRLEESGVNDGVTANEVKIDEHQVGVRAEHSSQGSEEKSVIVQGDSKVDSGTGITQSERLNPRDFEREEIADLLLKPDGSSLNRSDPEYWNVVEKVNPVDVISFKNLDVDGDGFISHRDLDRYQRTNELSEFKEDVVNNLRENIDEWQKISNDEYFFENNGVSELDLCAPELGEVMNTLIDENFADMDTDGDGILREREIRKYASENDLGTKKQLALNYLGNFAKEFSPPSEAFSIFKEGGLNVGMAKVLADATTSLYNKGS